MPTPKKPSPDDMEPTGELCTCPDFLNDFEKQCWAEIVAIMPPGILKNADAFAVEALARLMAKIRTGQDAPAVFAQLGTALDRFGMTPSSRSKVRATPPPRRNKFADLDD